jgi:hypothetical protein
MQKEETLFKNKIINISIAKYSLLHLIKLAKLLASPIMWQGTFLPIHIFLLSVSLFANGFHEDMKTKNAEPCDKKKRKDPIQGSLVFLLSV